MWLSEIEKDPWSTRQKLYMAHILRELGKYTSALENVLVESHGYNREKMREHLPNDAKELLG